MIGNSSSAIREGSYIGVPAVSIGSRQNSTERGKNVLNAKYNAKDILAKIKLQLKANKKKLSSNLYGDINSSKNFKILSEVKVDIQKTLNYK